MSGIEFSTLKGRKTESPRTWLGSCKNCVPHAVAKLVFHYDPKAIIEELNEVLAA
jgi:hypothetical protein